MEWNAGRVLHMGGSKFVYFIHIKIFLSDSFSLILLDDSEVWQFSGKRMARKIYSQSSSSIGSKFGKQTNKQTSYINLEEG